MRWSPLENVTYEFVLASAAVLNISYLSYLVCEMEGSADLFSGVLLPGFIQNST